MADDIVTRLRAQDICHDCLGTELCWEAADEIERLRDIVHWFVQDRLDDWVSHPEIGEGLAYDGVVWPRYVAENLPTEIVKLFKEAYDG